MTIRMPTEKRRLQIVEAAIKIIGEKGLREFTAAQIAQEVGIKDGTIFRHFKNKDKIVSAVLDHMEELLEQTVPPPIDDPLERLGKFFWSRVRMVTHKTGIQSLLFSDQLGHASGESGLKQIAKMRAKGREYIKLCLTEACQKKLIREGLKPEDIVVIFHGMVIGLLFLAKDHAAEGTLEHQAGKVWISFLSMIRR